MSLESKRLRAAKNVLDRTLSELEEAIEILDDLNATNPGSRKCSEAKEGATEKAFNLENANEELGLALQALAEVKLLGMTEPTTQEEESNSNGDDEDGEGKSKEGVSESTEATTPPTEEAPEEGADTERPPSDPDPTPESPPAHEMEDDSGDEPTSAA